MQPQNLLKRLTQTMQDKLPSSINNQPSVRSKPKPLCGDCGRREVYGTYDICLFCLRRKKYEKLNPDQRHAHRCKFVPLRYADAALDDLSAAVRQRVEGFENFTGLYIWGDVRLGKTHILAALANHLIARGRMIKWISFGDFLAELRSTYTENPRPSPLHSERMLMDKVMSVACLFIDDLGAECPSHKPASDYACQVLFRILNNRGNDELPTCISSNKPISEIGKNYDPRIEYRLREYTELPVTGKPRKGLMGRWVDG